MGKVLKQFGILIPALLLAFILLVVPQLNNSELMLPTQSGKAFGFLWGMLGFIVVVLFIAAIKREIQAIRVTLVDLFLGAYCLLVVISYWQHPSDQIQMFSFFALAVFYLGVRVLNRKYQLLLLVAVAVSGLIQATYGNLQLWGYYPSHHGIFRMTGSFFNPGPYAGYMAAIFPVALGLYFGRSNVRGFDCLSKKKFEGLNKTMFERLNVRIFDRFSNHEVSNPSNVSNVSNGEAPNPFNSSNPSNSEATNNQTQKTSNILNRIHFISRFFYNNPHGGDTPEKQAEHQRHTLDSIINYFVVISMIAMCLVLPASRSRAAWLAVVVSAAYLFSVKYRLISKIRTAFNTRIKRLSLISSLIILLTITGAGLYYLKKDSADGRLLIWKVSTQMIKDKPIFGHGAGKFAANYMNYQAAYFKPNPNVPEAMQADNVTYSYNEFLKLTVEKGMIGLLLGLGVIWSLFFVKSEKSEEGRRQKSESRRQKAEVRRQKLSSQITDSINNNIGSHSQHSNPTLLAARGGLLSILVFSLFSYPSDILPIKMLFVLFMAIVASHQSPIKLFQLPAKETALMLTPKAAFTGKVVWYAALVVVIIAVYPTSQYLAQQYHAYKSWKDASDIYNVGAYPESLEDFELAYPLLKTNGIFLMQYGKALEMAEKYESSVAILNEAKRHLNNTILYTCLGNNYKALGKHTEAEQAYLQAWNMAPARFYPLYLLAKLYDETEQHEKAVEMAKIVMDKEVKIESTAVEEIKEEMRKIIEKSNAETLDNSDIHTDNNLNPIYKGTKEGAYRSVVLTAKFMLQKW